MGVDSQKAPRRRHRLGIIVAVAALLVAIIPMAATAQEDPRVGLGAGLWDAETAIEGLEHEAWFQKRDGALQGTVSDLAFQGNYVYMGNYNGLQVFDVTDPSDPILKTEVVCPGSQNDPSVYGNLAFQSVEATGAKVDCTSGGANAENRFRGVRIWDISNPEVPVLAGGVQTCRGSHTHSIVEDPNDPDNIYIYVSGTASQRANAEVVSTPEGNVAGRCSAATSQTPVFDNRSNYMTEVIKVPLANPAAAQVVNEARLFRDFETGAINGLQNTPPTPQHPSGANWGPNPNTNTCHDITAYPEIGLAAGACQGNGVLIDISDPANPVRIDAVNDPNFAYWHSATFNNDGTSVLFTDEWGGGGGAYCQVQHELSWGANAIFDIVETEDGLKMELASYYKMAAPQTSRENCVAHNGNLIPVPGRDIMVQAWYQGGLSIFDWTDTANPTEIAFFDRGPISATANSSGGFWSTYWWNGYIYGSELTRGLDVFSLVPTDNISESEIAAALEIQEETINVQGQIGYSWGPSLNVIGAHRDQLDRIDGITDRQNIRVDAFLADAEAASTKQQLLQAAAYGHHLASQLDSDTQADLVAAVTLVADDLYSQARPSV